MPRLESTSIAALDQKSKAAFKKATVIIIALYV